MQSMSYTVAHSTDYLRTPFSMHVSAAPTATDSHGVATGRSNEISLLLRGHRNRSPFSSFFSPAASQSRCYVRRTEVHGLPHTFSGRRPALSLLRTSYSLQCNTHCTRRTSPGGVAVTRANVSSLLLSCSTC